MHETAWTPDSSALLFSAADATSLAIVRAPVDGGTLSQLDLGDLVPQSALDGAIARDGSLVFVASAPRKPPELYHLTPHGKPERVSDYNAAIAALDILLICMIDSSIVINRSEIAAHYLRPGQRPDYYSRI